AGAPGEVTAPRTGRRLGRVHRPPLAVAADRPVRPVQPGDLGTVPGARPGPGAPVPRRRPRLGHDPGLLRRRRDRWWPARPWPPPRPAAACLHADHVRLRAAAARARAA